ncbi:nucleotidyltransferase domain-containing protein [Methylophaga sp. OBS1]|uniref:nucleotidyltransferase domain-containing protein n=1 Tax=Methylophaga sp. OBS1 TaxID=2991933 RepID=UPI0022515385|nr:nucleotidyltransferase domain-containing protein [Methylophaga sp. OBS1]MCX4191022.1 helix-turn-helix domain-containing protein [Methylophaga sp. OBS1]MCX4192032.1 helix-turn-helix domain-containing protein [Methylophaga sp. OBS1]
MSITSIADALFTKTQQRVLGLLFSKPGERFYTNEILRRADMGRGTVTRELEKLAGAGLVLVSREGNQQHYQANPASPIFEELVSIARKTFGVADVLRHAMAALSEQIDVAFVFGSMASGEAGVHSDIDLCVVGEVSFAELVKAVYPCQQTLGREINPKTFTLSEWQQSKKKNTVFLQELLHKPVINVIGNRDDLA